jgi:two-component system, NarL family, sensor histidine kinase UhpB
MGARLMSWPFSNLGRASPRRRRISARAYYAALSAALLFPTLLAAWWFANVSAASEQAQVEQNLLQQAHEISTFIDREVVSHQNMLIALGSSQLLQGGNLEAFHLQASEVASRLGVQIVVRDLRLETQSINTALPRGANLADGAPAPLENAEREALRSGQPVISNIFWGALVKRYVAAVIVPVMQDNAPAYYLSVGIPAERFVQVVRETNPGTDEIVTITDRNRVVVARSDRNEEFVGKQLPSAAETRETETTPGIVTGTNLEGNNFHWGYICSQLTGWNVSVGIAESGLQARSNRLRAGFVSTGVVLLLVTMMGAYKLAGRFSESFGVLGIDRTPTREEFQVLFEDAPNGVVVADAGGSIALLNKQMETMFGYSREELIGKRIETLLPERLRDGHLALRTTFTHAPAARPMGAGRNLFGRRRDGVEFPIEIGLKPIRTATGKLVMATVVDITRRQVDARRLSGALAERDDLRRRFMQAQEDERLRLAHELHDQTGQSLTAIMMEMKDMENLASEADRDRLRLLRGQLDQMGKVLHHVAWELRPASIDDLGLASSLANYVSEWSHQYGIDADFYCGDSKLDELSNEIRTSIYRITQEALTNVAKHTPSATSVSVVIDRTETTVRLTIEDNGRGFDTASNEPVNARGGLGLAGMRERITLVGGELEIESSPGAGTTIFARIPVQHGRAAA